jgi:hypothetical protein
MKITMQLTIADLIRTLRWQAIELAEEVAVEKKGRKDSPYDDAKNRKKP